MSQQNQKMDPVRKSAITNGIGSIGETTRAIILPIQTFPPSTLIQEANNPELFALLIQRRIDAARLVGLGTNQGSYLPKTGMGNIYAYYGENRRTFIKMKKDIALIVWVIINL